MAVKSNTVTAKRPMVPVRIRNQLFKMLYDTGSSVTCMSSSMFHQLQSIQANMTRLPTSSRRFTAADGGRLPNDGLFELELEINGKTIKYPFHILPNLHENFIIGIDFIKKFELNLCLKHLHFHWNNQCPKDHTYPISSCKEIILPPNSTCLIPIQVKTPPAIETNICLLTEIHVNERPWLQGAPSLVQTDQHQRTHIELSNASLTPRIVQPNEILGWAEQVDPTHLQPLPEPTDMPPPLTSTPCAALSDSDRDFINKHANIKASPATENEKYLQLFYRYSSIFSKHKNDLGQCDLIKHEIHLKTKEPVYIKQFKIPEGHQDTVTQQVTEWLKLGVIQAARSRYNSPIFVVKKKDGSYRLVQDFRALNQNTYIDKYSMRDVSDCIHEIGKAESTIFSTIDLTSGFWQMVLEPKSRPLTAFTVYGMGQFQFTTSPMGLLGCPASFQRLMEAVTKGIPNVIVYIDDILVHSKTHDEHRNTLTLLFQRLLRHNLKIRLEKCHFAKLEVEYLGFKLTPNGILPGTDKTQAVRDTKPPTTVHQVRQFLGLCNFFRQHIKQFALRSHPLTSLTRKDSPWKSGPLPADALKAFNELKTCLTSKPIVSFPKRHLQYALITDAATGDDTHPGGMGAILTQVDKEGKFYVIAYASKKIEKHEKNYTPFLLEMYAAVWGMEHFSHHLRGKRFLLFTDHKPLEKLGKVHTKTLYRIQEAMLNYDFEIHYRKGDDMPADYLSRNILSLQDDLDRICQEQRNDPQLGIIITYLEQGKMPINKEGKILITKYANRCFLENDLLWIRFFDPIVGHRSLICAPKSMVPLLCHKYHQSWHGGHEGVNKTKHRLLCRYFWPNMEKDITNEVVNCHQCQLRKKDNHPKAFLRPLPSLTTPNQRIHADLFGPLKVSQKGKKFILVITDGFTKYIELVATENKEADTIAHHIFSSWICRFGIPTELVTDQGKEFTAQVCKRLWDKLDIIHSTTSARHPQTNSQAEVINKTIARYLSAFVDESTLEWEPFLPPLMFSYNTSYHRSIKTSPFFLTYGIEPSLPKDFTIDYHHDTSVDIMSRLQLARKLANQHIADTSSTAETQYNKHVKPHQFTCRQQVLLDEHYYLNRNQKIAPNFTGPHIISQLKGPCNVELLLNNGKTTIVHVNRLKPYFSHESSINKLPKGEKGLDIGSEDHVKVTHHDLQEESNKDQTKIGEGQTTTGVTTRRQAKAQGLVYNEQSKTFRPPSPTETIEVLRRKAKKKIIHRKIKDTDQYILIEDVYYQVKRDNASYPSDQIKTEPIEEENEDEEEIPPFEQTTPSDIKPKRVLFKSPAEVLLKPTSPRPKSPPKPTSFTKELLKNTAELFRPKPQVAKPAVMDDRPIRGTTKSFFELLDEIDDPGNIKTEPSFPANLPVKREDEPQDEPPPLPAPTAPPIPPLTEENNQPSASLHTRSHHPTLHPGLP